MTSTTCLPSRHSVLARLAGMAVAVTLASSGCSGSGTKPTASPSPRSPVPASTVTTEPSASSAPLGLDGCVPASWRTVRLRSSDGVRLAAAETGRGAVAVAFAHESDSSLCSWVPYATELARSGVRVLVLDARGHGSSQDGPAARPVAWDLDVAAAAGHLRRTGAKRVALVGASAGGTAALVAAATAPHVAAVASLSGPAEFASMNAAASVPSLHVPVLYLVGALDAGFVNDARRLAARTRGPHRLVIVPDVGFHGTALFLDPQQGRRLSARLTGFLTGALAPG